MGGTRECVALAPSAWLEWNCKVAMIRDKQDKRKVRSGLRDSGTGGPRSGHLGFHSDRAICFRRLGVRALEIVDVRQSHL